MEGEEEEGEPGAISDTPQHVGAITPARPLGQKERLDSEAVGAAVEGAVAALKEREYLTLLDSLTRLTTCHQPELEVRDQETKDMLFKIRASTGCGVTRGGGASQGGQSEETLVMKEVFVLLY